MDKHGKTHYEAPQLESGGSPTVTSIGDWKNRKSNTPPFSLRPISTALTTQTVTRSQMQAALLRLLLSDEIRDADLDAILQAALSILAANKPGE